MTSKKINPEPPKTEYELRLDENSTPGALYVGKALPGSSQSDSVWQIKKVTDTQVSFAESDTLFNKVWNDRTSYTYN